MSLPYSWFLWKTHRGPKTPFYALIKEGKSWIGQSQYSKATKEGSTQYSKAKKEDSTWVANLGIEYLL